MFKTGQIVYEVTSVAPKTPDGGILVGEYICHNKKRGFHYVSMKKRVTDWQDTNSGRLLSTSNKWQAVKYSIVYGSLIEALVARKQLLERYLNKNSGMIPFNEKQVIRAVMEELMHYKEIGWKPELFKRRIIDQTGMIF